MARMSLGMRRIRESRMPEFVSANPHSLAARPRMRATLNTTMLLQVTGISATADECAA
jgi:hypothetical protein